MDKYIETDIENGLTYLKCAVMNTIAKCLETKHAGHLPNTISIYFVIKCLQEDGWKITRLTNSYYCAKNSSSLIIDNNISKIVIYYVQ